MYKNYIRVLLIVAAPIFNTHTVQELIIINKSTDAISVMVPTYDKPTIFYIQGTSNPSAYASRFFDSKQFVSRDVHNEKQFPIIKTSKEWYFIIPFSSSVDDTRRKLKFYRCSAAHQKSVIRKEDLSFMFSCIVGPYEAKKGIIINQQGLLTARAVPYY